MLYYWSWWEFTCQPATFRQGIGSSIGENMKKSTEEIAFAGAVLLTRQRLDKLVRRVVKAGFTKSEAKQFLLEVTKKALKK